MLRYTIIRRVESGPIIGLHWMPGWALGCRSNTTAPAPLRPGVRQQHVKGSNQHIIHSASTRPKNTIQNARQLRRSGLFVEPCCRRAPSSVGATWCLFAGRQRPADGMRCSLGGTCRSAGAEWASGGHRAINRSPRWGWGQPRASAGRQRELYSRAHAAQK